MPISRSDYLLRFSEIAKSSAKKPSETNALRSRKNLFNNHKLQSVNTEGKRFSSKRRLEEFSQKLNGVNRVGKREGNFSIAYGERA
jgi:hypothetical protein